MLHFYQGGASAYSSVVLSPVDFQARAQRETKWFPDLTVKIRIGGREFTVLNRVDRDHP